MPKAEPTEYPALKKLYPGMSEEQLAMVEEAYDRYIDFCLEVLEAIENDPVKRAEFERMVAERKEREKNGEDSNRGTE